MPAHGRRSFHRGEDLSGRVFVHHEGALGDLLLSLPALAMIREHFGRLHLSGRDEVTRLIVSVGFVDEASSTSGGLFVSLYDGEPDDRLIGFLGGFDAAYVFSVRRDSAAVKAIREVVRDTTAILNAPPEGRRVHVSEFRMSQILQGTGERGDGDTSRHELPVPLMNIPEALRQEARALVGRGMAGRLLTIHPGSGGQRKCWPLTRFVSLAERLRDLTDSEIVMLSGPAEEQGQPLVDEFAAVNKNVTHLKGLELTHVAALLSVSACYIGNDSGISHLAGAVGAPSVVVFGPTDPQLWRPRGREVEVVASDVHCAPCGDSRSRICGERLCLDAIPVDMVLKTAETFLRKDAGPR